MLEDQSRAEGRARRAAAPIDDAPRFRDGELVLGAGTVLARAGCETDEARLNALLAIGYRRSIDPGALGHIRCAVGQWRVGDEALATLHLALARLGRMDQPAAAAKRLVLGEGLMDAGVRPASALCAFDISPDSDVRKNNYNEAERRVPAGNQHFSGRWTTAGGGASATASQHARPKTTRPNQVRPIKTRLRPAEAAAAVAVDTWSGIDLATITSEAAAAVVAVVTTAGVIDAAIAGAGAGLAFGVLVIPSTGPKGEWVNAGGPNDIRYFLQPDETDIGFRYTDADGTQQTKSVSPDPDGNYRGPDGNVIAKWVKTAAGVSLLVSAAKLTGDTDDPRLCPVEQPDRKGPRDNNRDYEDYVKAMINSPPTPRAYAYAFTNPTTGNDVMIDDCQHSTGALFEYKGPAFDKLFLYEAPSSGVIQDFLNQSERQVLASQGRPLTWVFAEKAAAEKARALFDTKGGGRERIRVIWIPVPGDGS